MVDKVILQLSLVLITAATPILIRLARPSFLDFWVCRCFLTLCVIRLHACVRFLHWWVMHTMFMNVTNVLIRRFWEATGNSRIWIKSSYRWILVLSWDTSLLLCILVAGTTSVVIHRWLFLSLIFCTRSISVGMLHSISWSIMLVTITPVTSAIPIITVLMSTSRLRWSCCTLSGTSLVLRLVLASRWTSVSTTCSFLLCEYTTTHMKLGWSNSTEVVACWWLLNPILRLSFPRLFQILTVNSRLPRELLWIAICRLVVEFHRVVHLLCLCRALWLIQRIRLSLINSRPTRMTVTTSKGFWTMRPSSMFIWVRCTWVVRINIASRSVHIWLSMIVRVCSSMVLCWMVWWSITCTCNRWCSFFRLSWGSRSALWLGRMSTSMTISSRPAVVYHLTSVDTVVCILSWWSFNVMHILF